MGEEAKSWKMYLSNGEKTPNQKGEKGGKKGWACFRWGGAQGYGGWVGNELNLRKGQWRFGKWGVGMKFGGNSVQPSWRKKAKKGGGFALKPLLWSRKEHVWIRSRGYRKVVATRGCA